VVVWPTVNAIFVHTVSQYLQRPKFQTLYAKRIWYEVDAHIFFFIFLHFFKYIKNLITIIYQPISLLQPAYHIDQIP